MLLPGGNVVGRGSRLAEGLAFPDGVLDREVDLEDALSRLECARNVSSRHYDDSRAITQHEVALADGHAADCDLLAQRLQLEPCLARNGRHPPARKPEAGALDFIEVPASAV